MESRDELIRKAGAVAEVLLQGQAERLRKEQPNLSPAQAYARVYEAPENVELRRAERMKNGFSDYAKREPTDISEAGQFDFTKVDPELQAYDMFQEMANELRKAQPHLTKEQAFSRVYSDPANAELRRAERAARIGV
jgi:hypothetical protein